MPCSSITSSTSCVVWASTSAAVTCWRRSARCLASAASRCAAFRRAIRSEMTTAATRNSAREPSWSGRCPRPDGANSQARAAKEARSPAARGRARRGRRRRRPRGGTTRPAESSCGSSRRIASGTTSPGRTTATPSRARRLRAQQAQEPGAAARLGRGRYQRHERLRALAVVRPPSSSMPLAAQRLALAAAERVRRTSWRIAPSAVGSNGFVT